MPLAAWLVRSSCAHYGIRTQGQATCSQTDRDPALSKIPCSQVDRGGQPPASWPWLYESVTPRVALRQKGVSFLSSTWTARVFGKVIGSEGTRPAPPGRGRGLLPGSGGHAGKRWIPAPELCPEVPCGLWIRNGSRNKPLECVYHPFCCPLCFLCGASTGKCLPRAGRHSERQDRAAASACRVQGLTEARARRPPWACSRCPWLRQSGWKGKEGLRAVCPGLPRYGDVSGW